MRVTEKNEVKTMELILNEIKKQEAINDLERMIQHVKADKIYSLCVCHTTIEQKKKEEKNFKNSPLFSILEMLEEISTRKDFKPFSDR